MFVRFRIWHGGCGWEGRDENSRINEAERTAKSGPTQEDTMLIKVYGALWIVSLMVAAIFAVTGNFGSHAMIGFGFAWFGLSFMGLMGVLPTWVGHQNHH